MVQSRRCGGAASPASRPCLVGVPSGIIASRAQYTALYLVKLDRFEKRLEVSFAKALVALALDDLVEHRADHRFGKDLQQQSFLAAIDEDLVARQPRQILAVPRQPFVDELVIRVRRIEECDAVPAKRLDGRINIPGRQRDMLDTLAVIGLKIFLDLVDAARMATRFIDRNADFAVRAGHRPAPDPGQFSFDVEIADLPKAEEPLIKAGPDIHAALMDVVRQVIDCGKADAARLLLNPRQRHKVDIVDRAAGAGTIDKVDQAAADPLDRRDVELHRADLALDRLGAQLDR